MISNIGANGFAGFQQATKGLRKAASTIAGYPHKTGKADFTRAVVELQQHEHAAKANIQTIKAENKAIGTLLDVKA